MSVRTRLFSLSDSSRQAVRDREWLLPALGAIIGIALAVLISNVEGQVNPDRWAVSVDRARDTLLGALAIVFTGLSIVLALTATAAQANASKFSIRLLRVQQRGLRDRSVIGVFTLTTAFIVTTQMELRSFGADAPAPRLGLMISAVLVLLSGATIIWYISATMRSLRLDRAMQQVIRIIRRTMRSLEHKVRGASPVPVTALEAPADAMPLRAYRHGYVAGIDLQELHRLAAQYRLRLGIETLVGAPVLPGQPIGWMVTQGSDGPPSPPEVASAAVQIARIREPERDVAYGVRILVDMAIMALSPAVNDPYTAVEVVNELTFVLVGIAHHHPGPRGFGGPDDGFSVVRAGRSLGDYLEIATEPILLYGGTDPQVRQALAWLAENVAAVCELESDRSRAHDLARRVAAAGAGEAEGGRSTGQHAAETG